MTLTELLQQVASMTDAEAKGHALVFGEAPLEAIRAAQQQRPTAQHRAVPMQLVDGRYMLCADLLLEVHPGGLYADGFASLPAELFAQVDVIPWNDAVLLLPQPEMVRARNPDGTFRADDPATPDVDEAWEVLP